MTGTSEIVFADLAAERVAMNSEYLRGAALVPICAFQGSLDELLLEFRDGFLEQNAPLDHKPHE